MAKSKNVSKLCSLESFLCWSPFSFWLFSQTQYNTYVCEKFSIFYVCFRVAYFRYVSFYFFFHRVVLFFCQTTSCLFWLIFLSLDTYTKYDTHICIYYVCISENSFIESNIPYRNTVKLKIAIFLYSYSIILHGVTPPHPHSFLYSSSLLL